MPTIHFTPPTWRKLTNPQKFLVRTFIEKGPQLANKRNRRTIEALVRRGLAEPVSASRALAPLPLGSIWRASGKAWEVYRELQSLQGFASAWVRAVRS